VNKKMVPAYVATVYASPGGHVEALKRLGFSSAQIVRKAGKSEGEPCLDFQAEGLERKTGTQYLNGCRVETSVVRQPSKKRTGCWIYPNSQ